MANEGLEKVELMRAGGVPEEEIDRWKRDRIQALTDGGAPEPVIKDYFGIKEPDPKEQKSFATSRWDIAKEKTAALMKEFPLQEQKPEAPQQISHADGFVSALEAGFEMSVTGLKVRGQLPDTVLPEHAPTYMRIASQVGTLAGDLPFMVAGGAAGGIAGTAVPIVGNVVGAGAGAMALPSFLRKRLMDQYESGSIQSFGDFWSQTAGSFIEAGKGAIIGGATAGVGGAVGRSALSGGVKTVAELSAEVATMTAVGAALEGKIPEPEEILDAALLVGGLRGAGVVSAKLRERYAQTGEHPSDIAARAKDDPIATQELTTVIDKAPEVVEKPKAAPPEYKNLSEAESAVLSRIGKASERAKEPYTEDQLYTDLVDKLYPIKAAGLSDAYKLFRMASDAPAKAKGFMEFGVRDFHTNEIVHKGLMEIVKPFEKDINGFKSYLISERVLEVNANGIKTGVDISAAEIVVKEGKAKYKKAAEEVVGYQNAVLKYLRDSGAISNETYNDLVGTGKSFIPLKRILEDGPVIGGKGSAKNPIKALKGSELEIQDPFLSIIERTELYTKAAERTRALKAVVEDTLKDPEQSLIKEVKRSAKEIELQKSEIAALFKEYGMEPPKDAEGFSIFRGQPKDLLENQFEVFVEGKRRIFETDVELAKAIKSIDGAPAAKNIAFKIAAGFTNVLKFGITTMPDFVVKNLIRDQVTSGVFTAGGVKPLYDVFYAMKDITGKSKAYQEWLQSGGANGAFLEMGETYYAKNIGKLNAEAGGVFDKAWNTVKTGADYVKVFGSLIEQAPRLAEFKRVTKGDYSRASVTEGGFAAREITLDFQRVGARVQALNAISAFLNVKIQGLDKTVRAFKERPAETTMRAAALITTPSVLLWWANKDDERYKAIPRWQKDFFWIIPTDDWQEEKKPGEALAYPDYLVRKDASGKNYINRGTVWRIPKPGELGVAFGSLPERVLEAYFNDNPKAFASFQDTLAGLIIPDVTPNIAKPVVEQYFNKSTFTGNKVVPFYMEEVLPEYQYTDYTSETAKALAKVIGKVPIIRDIGSGNVTLSSPMVVENYIRGWTGTLGAYAMKLTDKALEGVDTSDVERPEDTLADLPVVKAFVVRFPSSSSQNITDFYESYKKNQTIIDTATKLKDDMNFEEYSRFVQEHAANGDLVNLVNTKLALSNLSSQARKITKLPGIPGDEKRQLIESLYYQMDQIAKQGNEAMAQIKKAK